MAHSSDDPPAAPSSTAMTTIRHAAPPNSLSSMPNEVLLLIVERVTWQDLHSLCLTARWLPRTAQLELFKRYPVYLQRRRRYCAFLDAVALKPYLGAHVRELNFWLFKRAEPNPSCFVDPDRETYSHVVAYTRSSTVPSDRPTTTTTTATSGGGAAAASAPAVAMDPMSIIIGEANKQRLRDGLDANDGEAVLIALLARLPNLEKLAVWLEGYEQPHPNVQTYPRPGRLLANFLSSVAVINGEDSKSKSASASASSAAMPLSRLKTAAFAVLCGHYADWSAVWTTLDYYRFREDVGLPWMEEKGFMNLTMGEDSDGAHYASLCNMGSTAVAAYRGIFGKAVGIETASKRKIEEGELEDGDAGDGVMASLKELYPDLMEHLLCFWDRND